MRSAATGVRSGAMGSADDYQTGALKRQTNEAGETVAVAIRTGPQTMLPWAVMTVDRGGHHADHAEVADWVDV